MFLTKIDHGIPYTDKRWLASISKFAHSLLLNYGLLLPSMQYLKIFKSF